MAPRDHDVLVYIARHVAGRSDPRFKNQHCQKMICDSTMKMIHFLFACVGMFDQTTKKNNWFWLNWCFGLMLKATVKPMNFTGDTQKKTTPSVCPILSLCINIKNKSPSSKHWIAQVNPNNDPLFVRFIVSLQQTFYENTRLKTNNDPPSAQIFPDKDNAQNLI